MPISHTINCDLSNNIWYSAAYQFDQADNKWNWNDNLRTNQKSKASASISTYGSDLFMVHLGNSSNKIWYSWFNDDSEVIWTQTTPANVDEIPSHPNFGQGIFIDIGQREGLSIKDIEAINLLYPPQV